MTFGATSRGDAEQQRHGEIGLLAVGVGCAVGVEEARMEPRGEFIGPLLKNLGLRVVAQDAADLAGKLQAIDEVAVVEEEGGTGIDAVLALLSSRRHPVAQEVPLGRAGAADAHVGLQQAVAHLRVDKGEPFFHHRPAQFERPAVAIGEVDLPGHGDAEAAPDRAAAGVLGVGRGVGHVALRVLSVAPIGRPLGIERPGAEVEHSHFHRRPRVAAVAQPLAVRAVDGITAEAEALVGPAHHVVDLVE